LFERKSRKVLVTTAGRAIVERARRMLVEADDLTEAGRRASDPLSGTLRVGVIPTVAPYVLPSVAPALRRAFRGLTVAWREDKTEALVAGLRGGALDALLLATPAEIGDVEQAQVAEDRFVVAHRRDHPLARRATPIDAAALRDQEVLLLDEGHCFRDQVLDVCSTARAREGEFRATSLATLVQLVASGAGITLLPALAVETEVRRASLRVRPIASKHACRTIALVWRKRSPLGPALREVARVLGEAFPRPKAPRRDR
jgi:LysR family hydrogen peroxide-inducible transcriptional activator